MNDTIPTLEPFIEPASVGFTPDAPGWYVLAAIFLLVVLIVAFFVGRRYRKNRYRREALKWLEGKEKELHATQNNEQLVYAAGMLTKQISIKHDEREKIASLRGKDWIEYLNKTCPSVSFTAADISLFETLYNVGNSPDEQQTADFIARIKQWIKKHRLPS